MDPKILQRLVEEAPTPISLLAQRAQNDCAGERQHHNAYYVFEFWLRVLSAVMAMRWIRSAKRERKVDEALSALVHPSVGSFLQFLETFGRAEKDQTLIALWRAPLSPSMGPGYKWVCEHCDLAPSPHPTAGDFARALATYRNKHIGHGALHDGEFYREGARALFGSVGELVLSACGALSGSLQCVVDIEDAPDGRRLAWMLELRRGYASRLIDPVPVASLGEGTERGQVFYAEGDARWCVFPWLYWHDNALLVLNRVTSTKVEYLNYLTGNSVQHDRALDALKLALRTQRITAATEGDERRGGRWIAGYELTGELGHGGMGTVYLARQASLDMPVALKVLPREFHEDPAAHARFLREVDILKRCEHPNIVSVLDAGEADGASFYAMEVVYGCSLFEVYNRLTALPESEKHQLRRADLTGAMRSIGERRSQPPSPLPTARLTASGEGVGAETEDSSALEAEGGEEFWKLLLLRFAEVADALHYLHGRGVLHRDIKPGNIMLTDDGARAVVMDLGIARTEASTRHTLPGGFVGTLRYASREQAIRTLDELDFRADLYSLGATMYELFTLAPLYAGDERSAGAMTEPQLLRKILDERPEPARTRHPGLRPEIGIILEKLLEKQPERRFYRSAAELAEDLRSVYHQRPIAARDYTAEERRAFELYDLLRGQATTWNHGRRSDDLLWREERTSELLALKLPDRFELTDVERQFHDASLAHAEALRQEREAREAQAQALRAHADRQRKILRRGAAGAALVLLAGVTVGVSVSRERLRQEQAAAFVLKGNHAERESRWDEAALYYAAAAAISGRRVARWVGRGDTAAQARAGLQREAALPLHTALRWSVRAGATTSGVAFSPDGRQLVVATGEPAVPVLSAEACGAEMRRLEVPRGQRVWAVAYSRQGDRIAAGTDGGSIELWSTSGWQRRELSHAHDRAVRAVAFSADGRAVFSAGYDGVVRRWGTADLRSEGETTAGTLVNALVASPTDSAQVAFGGDDDRVYLGAVGAAAPRAFVGHRLRVYALAFSPDGRSLLSGGEDDEVRAWDVADDDGREVAVLEGDVHAVAVSSSGITAAGGEDNAVRLLTREGAELRRLTGYREEVASVAFSPAGREIAVGTADGMVELRDLHLFAQGRSPLLGHTDAVENLAFFRTRPWLITCGDDRSVRIWDVATGAAVRGSSPLPGPIYSVDVSPDDQWIVAGDGSGQVSVWDASGDLTQAANTLDAASGQVMSVAWSPDGEAVLFGTKNGSIGLWQPGRGTRATLWHAHNDRVASVAFAPGRSDRIVSASYDGMIRVWEHGSEGWRPVVSMEGGGGEVYQVAWSHDGRWLASASQDRQVRLWDAATGRREASWSGHTQRVYGVAFSPDDRRVVSASKDMTLRVWERGAAQERQRINAHIAAAYSVAFSPDGRTVASVSEDRTVRLWDPATWREVGSDERLSSVTVGTVERRTGLHLRSDSDVEYRPMACERR